MTARPLRRLFTGLIAMALAAPVCADTAPTFAPIFGDHAVLQRDQPVRVWGTANAGQSLTVTLKGVAIHAKADATGRWEAVLPPQPAGGPYSLSLSGGAVLNDILIGDVFLCSGQSNMEFQTRYATNAASDIQNSANDRIRFVTIEKDARPGVRLSDLPKAPDWRAVGPETTGDTSAVCYYMSKAMHAQTGAPVGMIHSSWGGSAIQAWLSAERLKQLGAYDQGLETLKTYVKDPAAANVKWQGVMQDWWRTAEPDVTWTRPGYADRDWGLIDTSTMWEAAGISALTMFDGVLWYRTEVTLTAAQAAMAQVLNIGAVDDADTTFINGVYVGSTESWNQPRIYAVPKGVLKAGRNVIAVRALDSGGGGGLWGDPKTRGLTLSDGTNVPLAVNWKYKVSTPLSALKPMPGTPWLATSGLSTLYNGMIAPIAPYTLKGVAWYQGESNINNPEEYARLLPALFADWRAAFKQPDLPFTVVQLANFGKTSQNPEKSNWAELREVQRLSVRADRKTALAVAIDVGDRLDIHPTNKTVIGRRAALAMRRAAYGETVALSPEPVSATRRGNDIVVRFSDTGGKLSTYSSNTAIGFEACDTACRYVTATVEGDTIILKDAGGAVKIRYAWADAPYVNLYSAGDWPVAPFEVEVK